MTPASRGLAFRLALVAAALGLVAAFFALGLDERLTLESLKASYAAYQAFHAEHPALVIGGYFAAYVVMAALSLPGAAVMTLAGGALFGLWVGVAVVSFASSIGAALAFLAARFLLRDWVRRRFGERLERMDRGVEREGAFYLFTLRLVPAFPFFAINLAMALTPMRLRTFYWVSQLGMLPGTLVYVNAGSRLAEVRGVGDVFSPGLLLSFALLGVFPLVVKKLVAWYRHRRGAPIP